MVRYRRRCSNASLILHLPHVKKEDVLAGNVLWPLISPRRRLPLMVLCMLWILVSASRRSITRVSALNLCWYRQFLKHLRNNVLVVLVVHDLESAFAFIQRVLLRRSLSSRRTQKFFDPIFQVQYLNSRSLASTTLCTLTSWIRLHLKL